MKLQPLTLFFLGLFLISLGFNLLQFQNIEKLNYQIKKMEAGPAKGLFLEPEIPKPPIEDKELKELMERILKKMKQERMV
jgi:hypothetical protein